ncbi:MAG: HIT family protein [Gammaproteobacteria bacterium]|nr:HIT family protein [Gammaproteobacteria bacterium]
MASIFTKIINREIPGHFVWEDDLCFSIMTIQPIKQGHLMVIPKEEVDHWDDVPETTATHLMAVSQKIAKAIKAVIPCKRIGVSIVGIEVPHTHIHLMPMDTTADMDFKNSQEMSHDLLADTAASIREILVSQGYREAKVE